MGRNFVMMVLRAGTDPAFVISALGPLFFSAAYRQMKIDGTFNELAKDTLVEALLSYQSQYYTLLLASLVLLISMVTKLVPVNSYRDANWSIVFTYVILTFTLVVGGLYFFLWYAADASIVSLYIPKGGGAPIGVPSLQSPITWARIGVGVSGIYVAYFDLRGSLSVKRVIGFFAILATLTIIIGILYLLLR